MIPEFDQRGFLPHGVWHCTGTQFMERFVSIDTRKKFSKSILNVLDFAAYQGASSVLVGGSFITNKQDPSDFDCVILFRNAKQIPIRRDSLDIAGKAIDIFFASEDHPEIVKSFLKMFTMNRFDEPVGAVSIDLLRGEQSLWDITWEPDEELLEVVKRVYIDRHFVDKIDREKLLVTIHGISSYAEWNAEVTLIASANGWMVAPFHYGYVQPDVFLRKASRQAILDQFRDFLATITLMFGPRDVSVLAHSLGTYIACSYLLGFDYPPTPFDTLILTGAIVNEEMDLDKFNGKAALIVNEMAPNDEWVEWAKTANFGRDKLFGYAGTRGFSKPTPRLLEYNSDIFTHSNVIRRDIVAQRWMPILESNIGAVRREWQQDIINKHAKRSRETKR
jgi:pimeloyl-ACP methyl ester carboxylesterase